jgi:hypothetical protein
MLHGLCLCNAYLHMRDQHVFFVGFVVIVLISLTMWML